MAQIFPRVSNTIARAVVFGGILGAATGVWAYYQVARSPHMTRAFEPLPQPVPFSHKHHVGGVGLDCRYCHVSVEEGAFAGIPSTKTCMTCHSVLFRDAPTLEPVRAAWRENRSVAWTRVHDLPDYAYFDHSVHVARGVACVECHGDVSKMPLTWREGSLQMEWCLDCHRAPEERLRTAAAVFLPDGGGPADPAASREIARARGVRPLRDCSTCHR